MKQKNLLKPVDLLLKICLKMLFEKRTYKSEIYKEIEAEITDPNTRYRAKQRIKRLVETIKKENKDKELTRYFWFYLPHALKKQHFFFEILLQQKPAWIFFLPKLLPFRYGA